MINLNECKFGDRLKMRNGGMAIFVGDNPQYNGYDIVMQNDLMPSNYCLTNKTETICTEVCTNMIL